MKSILTIGEAAKAIGVCTKTIRRWDKRNIIECQRTPGGHRRISKYEIERIISGKEKETAILFPAIYARVSSHDQKKHGDLDRQIGYAKEYCRQKKYGEPKVFQDVGSGLNTKRKGFRRLCKEIEKGWIDNVVVTYPDRLTRFGFYYLMSYFTSHGTNIEVIHQKLDQTLEEELTQDIIAIITSFSGRIHGLRRKKHSNLLKTE